MGLLGRTLMAPLAPAYAVVWLAEQLERIAFEESTKRMSHGEALRAFGEARDRGEISEAEFERLAELVARKHGDTT